MLRALDNRLVLLSDILQYLDQDESVEFCDAIGNRFTWGDANRTLVDFEAFTDAWESSNLDDTLLKKALRFTEDVRTEAAETGVDIDKVYVDLEN